MRLATFTSESASNINWRVKEFAIKRDVDGASLSTVNARKPEASFVREKDTRETGHHPDPSGKLV